MLKTLLITGVAIATAGAISLASFVLGLRSANNYLQTPNTSSEELYEMIQNWREEQNLPKYTENPLMCEFAQHRAGEMLADFSHEEFVKASPEKQKLFDAGFHYLGENLAMLNQITFEPETLIFNGWMRSPKHKSALEANYTDTCIKCEGRFCVQIFGSSEDPE